MASLILGTLGTTLAGPFGGFIGSTIGSLIDAYLFTPDPPDVEGPRLEDTDATAADPGVPIPVTYGANRVGAIAIYTSDLIETVNVEKKKQGKKSYDETTYTYSVNLQLLINDGPILGVGRIWADGKLLRSLRADFEPDTQTNRYNVGAYPYPSWYTTSGRQYDPTQIPWSHDPSVSGAGATRWVVNTGTGALEVADAARQTLAETNYEIVYWQDPTSGYYLPIEDRYLYDNSTQSTADGSVLLGGGSTVVGGVRTWTDYYNLFAALNDFSASSVFQMSNPNDFALYRGTSDQPADAFIEAQIGETIPGYRDRAIAVFNNLQLEDFGNRIPNLTFEVVRFENETISTIIVDLLGRGDVSTSEYDLSELPTTGLQSFVPGYTVVRRTTIRKAIETLMEAFSFDASEINEAIVFRPRIRTADHVVQWDELAAHDAGRRLTPEQLTLNRRDLSDLPRTVEAAFQDIERDYQDNTERYYLTQAKNTHLATADLACVVYPYFAWAWTRQKIQDLWNGQRSVEIELPPKYIFISPSDILLIVTDKVIGTQNGSDVVASFNFKVKEVRRGVNGIISVKGILVTAALYPVDDYNEIVTESNYVGYANNAATSNVGVMAFLDLPPLNTSNLANQNGVYLAICDDNDVSWQQGYIAYSLDSFTTAFTAVNTTSVAAIGTVTTGTLSNPTAAAVITDTDTIVVTLDSATASLQSITETDLLNFGNLALIGDEILCFQTVTALGGRQYQISGKMIRGLKDTEETTHAANDRFVLLNDAIQLWNPLYEYLNQSIDYMPLPVALSTAFGVAEAHTWTGVVSKPFKPVAVTATRNGSNDVIITWQRQDRTFTTWPDAGDLPLSELNEVYEVDIYISGSVVRTLRVTEPTATYLNTNFAADGYTAGDPLDIRVYQLGFFPGTSTDRRGTPAIETV